MDYQQLTRLLNVLFKVVVIVFIVIQTALNATQQTINRLVQQQISQLRK